MPIAAAALAVVVANSAAAPACVAFLHFPLGPMTVHPWIDDGLMAVFFLLIA